MALNALSAVYLRRARELALAQYYAKAPSTGVFETVGRTNFFLISESQATYSELAQLRASSAAAVQQAVLSLATHRAQPIGLTSTYVGATSHFFLAATAVGTSGSFVGIPHVHYLATIDDTVQQHSSTVVSGFGVTTATTHPIDLTGYHVVFIGSLERQPDTVLTQHLLAATLDFFKKNTDPIVMRSLQGEGVLGAALFLISGHADVGLNIQLTDSAPSVQQLLNDQGEGVVLAIPADAVASVIRHYEQIWDIQATFSATQIVHLGTIQAGKDVISVAGQKLVDDTFVLPAAKFTSPTDVWHSRTKEPNWSEVREIEAVVLRLLAHPEISAHPTLQHYYDTTVMGNTIVEPGVADAGIVAPFLEENFASGVAVASVCNARYAAISPYWQSVTAVVESVRKIVASGAQAWGVSVQYNHPEQDTMDLAFAESVRGIETAATQLGVNLIAQKTGWYRAERLQSHLNPWPTTVQAIGKLLDASAAITLDFIQPGNTICLVGARRNELGGSLLYTLYNEIGSQVPQPQLATVSRELNFMLELIRQRLVPTCHVIGRGGIVKTLADMCYGSAGDLRTGITVDLTAVPSVDLTITQKLFSETGGFVFEIDPRLLPSIQRHAAHYQIEFYTIGQIQDNEVFQLNNEKTPVLSIPVGTLAEEWLRGWPGVI